MTTVILGTGIIGLSTAYHLSLSAPGSQIHLLDPSPTLFASASGNAGGFLARDWFAPALASLGELSFREHARLAKEFGGEEGWGYVRSTSVSYAVGERKGASGEDWLRQGSSREGASGNDGRVEGEAPGWVRRVEGDSVEVISGEGSTAQVDPLRLCKFLLQACLSRGVHLHHPAIALSLTPSTPTNPSSLLIQNTQTNITTSLPCTRILISAGVWTPSVFRTLFPSSPLDLPIGSLAGHSLVVRSPRWEGSEGEGAHALFTTDEEGGFAPEIFSRRGGEIYVAGMNDGSLPFPELATGAEIDGGVMRVLEKTARKLLGGESGEDLEVVRSALCFRPVTERGFPVLARVEDGDLGGVKLEGGGVWIAAGHGPWGISGSLGTGIVMAEMIQGKPTSADVSGLGL